VLLESLASALSDGSRLDGTSSTGTLQSRAQRLCYIICWLAMRHVIGARVGDPCYLRY
jgi:hypothetical protein